MLSDPPRPANDLSGAILDGRYRVIEPVAEGAMGIVYRAERVKLGRVVAVKVMHESLPSELSSRQRFEIEAMAMSRLDHPHCAAVLDVGVHEGRPYVVMDFVSGENLKDLVDAHGALPVVRVVEIMRQVLSGLAHAHELGIVHRDIKPANIVLSQKAGLGDHVKILDFGLARVRDVNAPSLTVGLVVGTPSYMAPEQCTGTAVDPRTDIYACGIMMFELLTGTKPFVSAADDPVEVVRMHISQPPPTLAAASGIEFGPELEAMVAKALAKKPEDRFQTATEFAGELDVLRARLISAPVAVIAQPGRGLDVPGGANSIVDPPAPALDRVAIPMTADTIPDPVRVDVRDPTPPPAPIPPVAPALSPRTVKIAAAVGGGVLVLIVVIAIATSGGSKAKPPIDAAVATGPTADAAEIALGADPEGDLLARAQALVDAGKNNQALDLLVKGRGVFPQNAQMAYLLGKVYFAKLYWNDGLVHFRAAIKLDPAYRSDPELIKAVLRGFITTPTYNSDLAGFLRNDIGALAESFLKDAAANHPNAGIRARAAAELRRYH